MNIPGQRDISILIVDDAETSMFVLEDMVRREGFKIVKASTAGDGIALATSAKPSLILLDVNLPDGRGPDVCKKLKTDPATSEIPVLFISGDSDVNSKVECFEAGGVDYITKPFEPREVAARVRTHLRLQEAQRLIVELAVSKINAFTRAQEAILPPEPSEVPDAKFAAFYRQLSGAGGDFYEIIRLGESYFDYLVIDVCGHDVGSSMVTAALKTLLAQNCTVLHGPAEVLSIVNKTIPSVLHSDQFIGISWVRLNRLVNKALIVNAAQPPVIFIPRSGTPELIESAGDIIGVFDSVTFETVEKTVDAGDRFLLYSDGLVEWGKKSPAARTAGIQKVLSVCRENPGLPLAFLVEQVKNSMFDFIEPEDDVVILGIEL